MSGWVIEDSTIDGAAKGTKSSPLCHFAMLFEDMPRQDLDKQRRKVRQVHFATGMLLGGGRRNRVRNNHFANVIPGPAIDLDDRGLGWQLSMCKSTANNSLSSRVKELLYPGSPWPVQYPELLNITTDSPCTPAWCEVTGNDYDSSSVKSFLTGARSSDWPSWHIVIANNTNHSL
eukprot:COSAG02_NODE_1493_length_12330_cov_3.681710_7_plen_175_part_00